MHHCLTDLPSQRPPRCVLSRPPLTSTHLQRARSLLPGFRGSGEIPGTAVGRAYLNNHLLLTVKFHKDPSSFEGSRIVGFEVEPCLGLGGGEGGREGESGGEIV